MTAVANEHVQRELLREAAENGPAAIFVVGDDCRYVAVNDFACRLLGYSREELLGLSPEDVSPDSPMAAGFKELVGNGVLVGESLVRTKTGRDIKVQYRAAEAKVAGLDFWVCVALPLDVV